MRHGKAIGVLVAAGVVLCAGVMEGAWFMPLAQLPGSSQAGHAFAVSADGTTVVGTSHDGFMFRAVRWTVSGGIQDLGIGDSTFARDVSADGSVIVGYQNVPGGQDAFRWTQTSGALRLGDFPGGRSIRAPHTASPLMVHES